MSTSPHLVDVPGGLAVELFLGGRGRPVLAVHGTPSLAETMRPFLDAAGDRPRAAVDLPGHGRSAKALDAQGKLLEDDALLDEIAARILRTLDGLGWATCVGVGHSGGCPLLLRAALRDPSRFSAFLFAGPASELPERKAERRQTSTLYPPERFIDALDVALEYLYAPQTRAQVKPVWLQWAPRIDAQSSAKLLHAWGASRDVMAEAARLGIPTTVMLSTEDRGVPPFEAQAVADALGARVLRIPGDHFPFAEAPVEAAAAVRSFFQTA